ncbi:L-fucose:H+ symporter permease [Arachidicoccus ginsenosidimutans]|uniref:L-fucose:H+ symporter permease n=1 Tax=Arachidicoccus sp. BS20 TaxID=1850526 RepID=UPI0007F1152F|nr:L-fucose:H+ symporter permease [Arachidicoccus sp. BS20]ANI89636.1 L-fucose:H+ symporter permease [Arachidicoccus sp. BS20]
MANQNREDIREHKIPVVEKKYHLLFGFLTSIFFIWGFSLTMMDVLNKHFQTVLNISKSRSSMIQLSTFGAYAIAALPVGFFMKKFGYKPGIFLGLFLFAAGAFLFIPAANGVSFNLFRIAIFVLACGMATLETVAHPFIASLGNQQTSDIRINFAQSFNGFGGVIGPIIGSYFLLNSERQHLNDLVAVRQLYIIIGCFICLIAFVFFLIAVPKSVLHQNPEASVDTRSSGFGTIKALFQKKHFLFSILAQFFNVAAQAGTWAYFLNYGHEVMNFTDERSGYFFSFSIVLLVLGRFLGTFLMRYIAPYKLLAFFSFCNILMCILVAQGFGWVSFTALILINFFFSIMYPTIFSLGLKDLGKQTEQASSFIVLGFIGGAVFPPLMGFIANKDTAMAYYLPIICYIVIMIFGIKYPSLNKSFKNTFSQK